MHGPIYKHQVEFEPVIILIDLLQQIQHLHPCLLNMNKVQVQQSFFLTISVPIISTLLFDKLDALDEPILGVN